ncbi:ABC transporter substrate-binding protein [Devosia sp.]|uniref:ABC transporter substrate-binding protein n=1 Tax=Devosia sp. TaxID=1871048 RepID=UPI002F130586
MRLNRRAFVAGALAAPLMSRMAFAQDGKAPLALELVQNHPSYQPSESVFLWGVPRQLGWFEEEGVDLGLQAVNGSTPALQAVISNSAALAAISTDILMKAREQGGKVRSMFIHKTRSGWMLGVPPGSPLKSLSEFKGKRVGVSGLGSGAVNVLRLSFAEAGLQETDYSIIPIGQGAAAVAALESNNIDALGFWESAFAQLENAGSQFDYIPLPVRSRLAGLPICVTEEYLDKNRERLIGLMRCWAKAIVFTKANPDAALRLFVEAAPSARPANIPMDQWMVESKRTLLAFMENVAHEADKPLGWHNPEQWRSTYEFYVASGTLEGTVAPEDCYTNEFISEANNFDIKAIQDLAART